MALVFDSLGYSRKLREAGLDAKVAEAAADAAREFIMLDLVTKTELQSALDTQTLRLTIRLGTIVVAATGVLFAALRLIP